MTNYVVEASLRDSYASVQLSPELVQRTVDDKATLLLEEILAAFPEVDVTLTPDTYVQVKAHLMDVLTRKPNRQERKRKMMTEQVKTYNNEFKAFTVSFVYAYQAELLSFKYTVGRYVPNSSLSARDEDVAYQQFKTRRWTAYEVEPDNAISTPSDTGSHAMTGLSMYGLSEHDTTTLLDTLTLAKLHTDFLDNEQAGSSLVLTSDILTPKKSDNQLAVEALIDSLQKKASKFRGLKLTTEQEYAVDSTMLSCQQIESLISGAQEFSSTDQQEAVYGKAIPALTLLDEQFTQLQEDLNAEVIRELGIMEDYLNTKHARLSLEKSMNELT